MLPGFGLLSILDYRFGLWIPYFTIFAGVAHIALGLKAGKRYNPGMIVSLVLNIPVGTWVVVYLVNQQFLGHAVLNPHLLIGLGVNLALPVAGAILYRQYMKTGGVSRPAA